jgi:hypothetical protein
MLQSLLKGGASMKKLLCLMTVLFASVAFAADAEGVKYAELVAKVYDFFLSIPKVGPWLVEAGKVWGPITLFLTGISWILSGVNASLKAANKDENSVLSKIIKGISDANEYIKLVSNRNATPKQ